MKTKNVIILGAIGVALYYLLKKEKPSFTQLPDDGDKDLQDVINGDEPSSLSPIGTDEVLGVNPIINMSDSQKESLFNTATNFYKGGARPSESFLQKLKEKREIALAKIKAIGLLDEFEKWKENRKKKDKDLPPPMFRVGDMRTLGGDVILMSASRGGSRPPLPDRSRR